MAEDYCFAVLVQVLEELLGAVEGFLIGDKVIRVAGSQICVEFGPIIDQVPGHEIVKYLILRRILNQELPKSRNLRQIANLPIKNPQQKIILHHISLIPISLQINLNPILLPPNSKIINKSICKLRESIGIDPFDHELRIFGIEDSAD